VIAAAGVTTLDLRLGQILERQVQTLFFELRGPVVAPEDIVILAVDEASLSQQPIAVDAGMEDDPLATIQTWPWQRQAYGIAIERLMQAGAQVVAVDIVFQSPSSYGPEDDQALYDVLQQYGDRVVLAAQYVHEQDFTRGFIDQVILPSPTVRPQNTGVGLINLLIEPDGKIHRFGEQFIRQLLANAPAAEAQAIQENLLADLPTFASATVYAATGRLPDPDARENIFYYGPTNTFQHIPFWYVLDDSNWQTQLQSGEFFRDKIVLIGSTAAAHQDFHRTPFGGTHLYPQPLSGVEIHASAIASLMEGQRIFQAFPDPRMRGFAVLLVTALAGLLIGRPRQPLRRWAVAMVIAAVGSGISFGLFTQSNLMLPTALPIGAIALSGFSQLAFKAAEEQQRKSHLRQTLKRYITSPVVQEIVSQEDDFHDLLQEREAELVGTMLGGRYKIVSVLGSGGFSETYVAQDTHKPSQPLIVVKKLRIISDNPDTFELARRLFKTEAESLEKLGQHDQIPRLLAFFEENYEFYLVEDLIIGSPLSTEFLPRRTQSEDVAILILWNMLPVLDFIHKHGIIHRDLKPSNIIRRQPDGKLVLIDFGVAKKITHRLSATEEASMFTVGVGTPGYMPSEQSAGKPRLNSDLYALGMIAIEALTGKPPSSLEHDPETGQILWIEYAPHTSTDLVQILNRMVHHDFTQRYQTARSVMDAIAQLRDFSHPMDSSMNVSAHSDGRISYSSLEEDDLDNLDTHLLEPGWEAESGWEEMESNWENAAETMNLPPRS
jgi:serine/threonine protein kinase/CHASE2 domain-containing sensor protein